MPVPRSVRTAQVGANRFYLDLVMVGMLYHLYNQVRLAGGAGAGVGSRAGAVMRCG
jgi:hypothetical protein